MNPQICFKQKFLQKICLLKIITNLNILKIMKKLQLNQMENLNGGKVNCSQASGAMCSATIILLYCGPFACLAAATGIGCALGLTCKD